MSGEDEVDNDFPAEHVQTVQNFQSSLSELESVMKVLLDVPLSEVHETKATTPLEKARIDIISAFALNSLTWMWLRTQGINPKETEVSLYHKSKYYLANHSITLLVRFKLYFNQYCPIALITFWLFYHFRSGQS